MSLTPRGLAAFLVVGCSSTEHRGSAPGMAHGAGLSARVSQVELPEQYIVEARRKP